MGLGGGALLILFLIWPATCQTPQATAEELAAKSDLAAVQSEINAAQSEDARYTGGLIKTLIATRIAILRQTEAMLEQKLQSIKLGAPVRYTIDGKVFTLPSSAPQMLADVEKEVSASEAKIRELDAEAARYRGGLAQSMSLTALETTRQTHAMLDQKRVSLKYALPQYVGFNDASANGVQAAALAEVAVTERASSSSQQAPTDELQKTIALSVLQKGFIPADAQSRRYEALLTVKCSYEGNYIVD